MIEKMKKICIVAQYNNKKTLLEEIRNLGVLHISEKKPAQSEFSERLNALNAQKMLLRDYAKTSSNEKLDCSFDCLVTLVDNAVRDKAKAVSDKAEYVRISEQIGTWGAFNPSDLSYLEERGIKLYFYTLSNKECAKLAKDKSSNFIRLTCIGKQVSIAVINSELSLSVKATAFNVPSMGLEELNDKIKKCNEIIENCENIFRKASGYLGLYDSEILKCVNNVEFSSVSQTSENSDGLVWISGYVPLDDVEKLTKKASECNWAYVVDDVSDDDEKVPTKVRYSKISRIIEPVFAILGTVPGYHEYDISFWFLLFFGLFFAMIFGDAGYGAVFLILGIFLNIKEKKLSNLTLLVYVVSVTTIIWGAITGTWFGLESAMEVPFLKKLVIPSIANYPQYFELSSVSTQNNVMKFCFMIGTVQLTLACVMNILSKLKSRNLSFIADIGWLISINALYYVVLLLVIGQDVNLKLCAVLIISGFVLVCCFGAMSPDKSFSQGLKSGLADSFTNFLNTISAFGNIMSYIRLFAVGLASLAIAQSFNDMAMEMTGFLKVAAIVIFVLGHALNLVMGLLSVVVHGVRLNLLEFSGQLGMEWSGTAYDPFKVKTKTEN